MSQSFRAFRESIICRVNIQMKGKVIKQDETCLIFQTEKGEENSFYLEKEWSERLTQKLGIDVCFLTNTCGDKTYYFGVFSSGNHLFEACVGITPALTLELESYKLDGRRIVQLSLSKENQYLNALEEEMLRIVVTEPKYRLAVVSGTLHTNKYDLLSMV